MKPTIALFILAAALCAALPASAQNHIAYQNALLARSLAPADQALCDAKAGSDSAELDKCHVTRLFVADLNRKQDQGFPPMTDIKYTSGAETNKVMDALTKYGG